MNPVFVQAGYYGIVMILSALVIGLIQKGFFWKFIRVRMSFGKFVMVKIRAVNRDYFRVGRVEEEFLVFKRKGSEEKRIAIPDSSYFYKAMNVTFIDVDDKTNKLCRPDYTTEGTFDAVKYDNLYKRALTRPQISDKMEKILLFAAIVGAIAAVVAVFMMFKMTESIGILQATVDSLKKGVVLGGGV